MKIPILSLSEWASIATITGAVIAVLALLYTAYQVKQYIRISRGQFWLEIEKMFSTHDEIYVKLAPGGAWTVTGVGPETAIDWTRVDDYMGLFEHCETLINNKLIDIETFKELFAYRVDDLLKNKIIVKAKLVDESHLWRRFHDLLKRLDMSMDSV